MADCPQRVAEQKVSVISGLLVHSGESLSRCVSEDAVLNRAKVGGKTRRPCPALYPLSIGNHGHHRDGGYQCPERHEQWGHRQRNNEIQNRQKHDHDQHV